MQDPLQPPDGFDPDLYLAINPDLRDAFDRGLIGSAAEHWRDAGAAETRDGSRPSLAARRAPCPAAAEPAASAASAASSLDVASYLGLNADLAAAFGADAEAARAHWLRSGAREGRPAFGGLAPWDRRFARDPARPSRGGGGVDVFVEADIHAHEEAALGRRVLQALRSAGCPVSVRAYTRSGGGVVLDRAPAAHRPTHGTTLLVAPPALARLVLAAYGPDAFAAVRLVLVVAAPPVRRHMPDWPLLRAVDGVFVPGGEAAARLATVSPVPVGTLPVFGCRPAARETARRRLGLPERAVLAWAEGDRDPASRPVGVPSDARRVSAEGECGGSAGIVVADRLDPWTGASRLLAAADLFVPDRVDGRATRLADAALGRRLAVAPDERDRAPPPSARAAGLAILDGLASFAAAAPQPLAREVAASPDGWAEAGVAANPCAPVLGALIDARRARPPLLAAALAALLARTDAAVELCIVAPRGVSRLTLAGGAGAAPCPIASDRRLRVRAAASVPPSAGAGLAAAAALSTATHLVPLPLGFLLADGAAAAARLARVAARLRAADAPDLLVAASHAAETRSVADAGLPLPLRERLVASPCAPVAVRADVAARLGGIDPSAFEEAAALADLTRRLVQAGVSLGALDTGTVRSTQAAAPPRLPPRRLRRRACWSVIVPPAVAVGNAPSAVREILRPAPGGPPLALADVAFGHVLLLARAMQGLPSAALDTLAAMLESPGLAACCPLILLADGTIAEAGLIEAGEGNLVAGPERGWPPDSSGPGRLALRVRDVHASAICLAARREVLVEHGFATAASADGATLAAALVDFARTAHRACARIACAPAARLRLARPHDGCRPHARRAHLPGTPGAERSCATDAHPADAVIGDG